MTNTQSKVPQLRFPEFSGSWTLTRAYKYCDLISGQHLSPNDYNTVCEGKPYFTGPSDFTESQRNVTKWTNLDCKKSKLGEILITVKGSGVGAMAINNLGTLAIGRQLMSIAPINGMNAEYIYQYFLTKRQYLQSLAMGNMIPGLSRPDILNVKFPLGSTSESEKIASFLSSVDKKSNLLKQKREQLVQYKKGIMQQLFSQQLRFKDYDGQDFPDWHIKKLGSITGKTGKKNKGGKSYPVYSINNKEGFLPQSDQFEGMNSEERGFDISMYKIVDKNTFAYNPARINVGSIGFSGELENIIVSSLYVCFQAKSELSDRYLMAYLDTYDFNKSVLRNAEGGVRQYLFYENFCNIRIPLPGLDEQNKIADFLDAIDQKINLAQQQIEQTQVYKQGLLQQMFV